MAPAPLTLLYDGRCSLCVRTADALRRLDRDRNRVRLVDFRADFAPADAAGISPGALEGAMHGIHPDGRVVAGPDAVRDALRAVGFGPVSRVLGWPIVGPLFGRLYDTVARNRLKWFAQQGREAPPGCDGGVCRIDHRL
jgi:predicted DCC family thiol-disulfide oxidoreductase YuxK